MNKKPLLLIIIFMLSLLSSVTFSEAAYAQTTLFWTADAYSRTGEIVTAPTLTFGYQYEIVAQEIFWYNYSGLHEADAMYYTTGTANWQWTDAIPCPDGHSFLQINQQDVDWGPLNNGDLATGTGHKYYTSITGQNEPITFQIHDWTDGNITNNNCHIAITIYEIPSALGMVPKVPHLITGNPIEPSNDPTITPTPNSTPTPDQTQPPMINSEEQSGLSTNYAVIGIILIAILTISIFVIKSKSKSVS